MRSDEWAGVVEQAVRRCRASGASREEAEDCVHDAVLAYLLRPENSLEIKKIAAWLAVSARNRSIDHVRRTRREQAAFGRMAADPLSVATPEEEVTERALAFWLAGTIERLPPGTRRVCAAIAEGRTSEEAAADLGISRRAVDSHLCRARRALRRLAATAVAALAGGVTRFALPKAQVALATATAATAATAVLALPPSPAAVPPATAHSERPRETAGSPPETVRTTAPPIPVQLPATTVDEPATGHSLPSSSGTGLPESRKFSAHSDAGRRLLNGGPAGPSRIEIPDLPGVPIDGIPLPVLGGKTAGLCLPNLPVLGCPG